VKLLGVYTGQATTVYRVLDEANAVTRTSLQYLCLSYLGCKIYI